MASRFRTLFFAAALAAALCVCGFLSGAEAAFARAAFNEPEGGIFPGEESRLPGGEERKALGLIFSEADLFLARLPDSTRGGAITSPPGESEAGVQPMASTSAGGGVKSGAIILSPPGKTELAAEPKASSPAEGRVQVYLALRNPRNFSSKKTAEGTPRPPMDFLGWGLTVESGGILSVAGFGPSGRFRGGAASPRERMPKKLTKLLSSMVGRRPAPAIERLTAYAEIDPKRAARLGLPVWVGIFTRFAEVHRAVKGGVDLPPARTVPGLPDAATAVKILLAILVIMIISLFNVGLIRQRRRKMREDMARKSGNDGMNWKI